MVAIPSLHQLYGWFGWGHGIGAVAAVSLILAVAVIFVPVLAGLALLALEKLQMKLLGLFHRNLGYYFLNFVTFPGTMVHELSHFLLALVTGAQVMEVCLLENKGGRLGHVSYRTRGPYPIQMAQHALIAVAPTVVGLVAGYYLFQYIMNVRHDWWGYVGLWYLLVSLVNHSSMSDVDLKNYFRGAWIFIIPAFAIFFLHETFCT